MNDDEINAFAAARLALLKQISEAVKAGYTDEVERLARAYRYLDGGPQPGSIEVRNG